MIYRFSTALLLILVIGLAYQNISLKKEMTLTVEKMESEVLRVKSQVGQEKKEIETLNQQLKAETAQIENQKKSKAQEIQSLMAQQTQEKAKLDDLRVALENLKKSSGNQGSNLKSQIQINNERLRNLDQQLKEAQASKKEVGKDKNAATKNLKAQAKYQEGILATEMKTQEQNIKDTEGQLAFWRKRHTDINQTAKLAGYNEQLRQQRDVLQKLKEQKLELAKDLQTRTSQLQTQGSAEASDIQDSEEQIQDQIRRIKEEQKGFQENSNQSDRVRASTQEQIKKLQHDYDVELSKYKTLEDSLKELQK